MKLYADRPVRRIAQLLADLGAVLLIVTAVWAAVEIHDQVLKLGAPGDGLVAAGSALTGTFDSAAASARDLPLVGGPLADVLHTGSAAGVTLGDAGRWQIDAVRSLALWLAVIVVALPLLFLLGTWLPSRWRFARRAGAAVRLRELGPDGHELLALRALLTQPLPRLARADGLATGWREGDPAVIATLARWELAGLGLHAPATARSAG
jgi:hypothetical protein